MTTVGARDARTNFAHLLDEVAAGGTVVITRRGREVARMVPAQSHRSVGETIAALRRVRGGIRLGGDDVRSLIDGDRA